jgi:hypothetical protein
MSKTLLKKLKITPSSISKLDKRCWAMRKAGQGDDQIAATLNIDLAEVESHYRNFEAIRASVSNEIVDMATNIESLVGLDGVGQDLSDARKAMRFTGHYHKDTGEPIYERDWSVVLDSVDKLSNLVAKGRSKEPSVAVNVGIQNNLNGNGNGGGARSFEAMVRQAEERRRLELGDGGKNVAVSEQGAEDGDEEDENENDIIDGEVIEGDELESDPEIELDDPDEVDDEE